MGNCFAVTNAGGAHVLFYRKSESPQRHRTKGME